MSLYVSRNIDDGRIDILVQTPEVFACVKLDEAKAVELADQLIANVDALALGRILDEC